MANQLLDLLKAWHPQRDELQWVLGAIYKTEGSCYRKAGAMMLFNNLGQHFGLLSGGCLESDIQRHARRVMAEGKTKLLCYDASDEDDLSFQLGIGCGGTVYILLQPVERSNNYLALRQVYEALVQRRGGHYYQLISDRSSAKAHFVADSKRLSGVDADEYASPRIIARQESDQQYDVLISAVKPAPHLLVIGGGMDAQPVINMATELGWETSLWDPRPANARREYFMAASHIPECRVEQLASHANKQHINAAILMSHNVKLDANALAVLQNTSIDYMALLGPASRREKVVRAAGLRETELKIPLHGPAGLDIGAELPEGIALSILAECHARLMQKQGLSLSTGSCAAA